MTLKCPNCGQRIECSTGCEREPTVIVRWIDGSWGFYCHEDQRGIRDDPARSADIKSVTGLEAAFSWPPVKVSV